MNNIRDLRYLVAVADCEHFGRAAKACCVSQPTLSMQIKKLEAQLGVTIFERSNKRVLITSAGQSIVNCSRLILKQCKEIKTIADHSKDPFSGDLKLGIIASLGPYLLPHILKPLKCSLPKLNFIIHEGITENLLWLLNQGELDAVILALPISYQGLIVTDLFYEPFYVALPNTHPLTKKKSIYKNELKNENLLLLSEGHCLRDQALEACQWVKNLKNNHFQATSLETLRHLVAENYGVTLLPALFALQMNKNITIRSFSDPAPSRCVGMVYRDSSIRHGCYEKIKTIIRKSIKKLPIFFNKEKLQVMRKNLL